MADGRHFENRYISSLYLSEKSFDFDEILYTAAAFELDESHLFKNEKSCIGQSPSSTEGIFVCVYFYVGIL